MDNSAENNDVEWAIGLNRFMLKIVGLWPQGSKNQREELSSKFRLFFNVITLIFILTIPALVSLIRVWGDMILVIDNLQYTLPLLITTLKVFIMWYNKEALSPLIKMIVKDWTKIKMKEEKSVMLKQAKITRFLAMCGLFMILLTLLITLSSMFSGRTLRYVTNLTDPGRPLAIQVYYLHDTSNSPKYELTYLVQMVALTTSGLSYTAVDNFLGLLILHICGQMENLHLFLSMFILTFCLIFGFLFLEIMAISDKIHRATYEYVWYTLEPKAARNLILIMLRAKKPLNITAGKTFPMTMATFCNLLKTSADYISVLLARRAIARDQ
ncbi:odorant receptor Or2-like [Pogonomyrmex barbatus]|uniref:Odorant receptor Or2-like n=1 Tax=Pogonomyrmex barbatus TaxID=144034 RepID=A0A8N1S6H0_9HYME|nr:odorant receptor Or2-like [Pogonomyrmex barbatus]